MRNREELSAEDIQAATTAVRQLSQAPRVDRLAAAREWVEEIPLADAIVDYEEMRADSRLNGSHDRAFGLYFIGLAVIVGICLLKVFSELSGLVRTYPSQISLGVLAAMGQALIIRFVWRVVKRSGLAITDFLNGASYPTILHPGAAGNADWDRLRLARLTGLLAMSVIRLREGAGFRTQFADLTRFELTRPAAGWLLAQAWVGRAIGEFIPPYIDRRRAVFIAIAAAIGCTVGLVTIHQQLESPARQAYVLSWACLLVWGIVRRP